MAWENKKEHVGGGKGAKLGCSELRGGLCFSLAQPSSHLISIHSASFSGCSVGFAMFSSCQPMDVLIHFAVLISVLFCLL